MHSLALELIHIHRINHSRIRKQEERQGTPVDSHMMNIVMRREEVCNGNLRPMRISILVSDGSNMVAGPQPSAHGARTGVSCGSTKSKKWHNLGSVSLCKNCLNSANKASGRCFRFLTLTSEAISQCLCGLKRSRFFFFLHCRTSARHGRSTTGISMRLKSNFPGRKKPTRNKTNQKQATPTHKPRHGPGKSAREICKLSETR